MAPDRRRPGGTDILLIGVAALGVFVALAVAAWALGIDLPRTAEVPGGGDAAESLARLAVGGVQDTARVVRLGQLGAELEESSGLAVSRSHQGVMWTHNDGGEAMLYAVRTDGTLVGMRDLGLDDVEDWEDIDLERCPPDGPSGLACLYVADVGDNDAERDRIAIDIIPEPDPTVDAPVTRLRRVWFTYPDGPADAEALAVTPDGDALIVTKGEDGEARLYRLGLTADTLPEGAAGGVRRATLVGPLPLEITGSRDRVTAAAISPDGTRLALRNHHAVYLFALERPLGAPILCEIGAWQPQGEGMDFVRPDMLVLTSEMEAGRSPIIRLRCP